MFRWVPLRPGGGVGKSGRMGGAMLKERPERHRRSEGRGSVGQAERGRRTTGRGFSLWRAVDSAIHRHVGHPGAKMTSHPHAGVDRGKNCQVFDFYRGSRGAQKMSAPEKSLSARPLGALAGPPSTGLSTGSVDESRSCASASPDRPGPSIWPTPSRVRRVLSRAFFMVLESALTSLLNA